MTKPAPKQAPAAPTPSDKPCVCVLHEVHGVRKISSAALFGHSNGLMIEHGTTVYFLRATKFGKLILTK